MFSSWWRHQTETFSALLAICAGNSPVPGEFPTQRPVTRSFDVYFDLRPNNGRVNNREAGDLRRHRAHHYDVIVMTDQIYTPRLFQWSTYRRLPPVKQPCRIRVNQHKASTRKRVHIYQVEDDRRMKYVIRTECVDRLMDERTSFELNFVILLSIGI